jgi:hypothetical protein
MSERDVVRFKPACRLERRAQHSQKKASSATITADVTQFPHLINTDEVWVHTARDRSVAKSFSDGEVVRLAFDH